MVSSLGRVKNTVSGKMLNPHRHGPKRKWYLAVDLQKIGTEHWKQRRKTHRIHRLVLSAFAGKPETGQLACHRNDCATDNRISNLYWGSRKDNASDSIRLGKFKMPHPGFGEKHHGCKYSDELLHKIKEEYTGERGEYARLSRKYGIHQGYIRQLILGELRSAA